jgi:hypothetical protein
LLAHAPKLKRLGSLTAFSAVWAQCTKATIPIVPIVVPSNVNFEAVDIAIDSLAICQNGTALLETIFKVAAFSREKASGGVVRMGLRTQFEPPQFGLPQFELPQFEFIKR